MSGSLTSDRHQIRREIADRIDHKFIMELSRELAPAIFQRPSLLLDYLVKWVMAYRLGKGDLIGTVREERKQSLDNYPKLKKQCRDTANALIAVVFDDEPDGWLLKGVDLALWKIREKQSKDGSAKSAIGPDTSLEDLLEETCSNLLALSEMFEEAEARARRIDPGPPGARPDFHRKLFVRYAAEVWFDATGKVPPVATSGPFYRFLKHIQSILPSDCRKGCEGLNPETVKDWLRAIKRATGGN